ncbi:YciI family protein [Vibrio ulleungensis]|uniref:YCII-related domain-containing protein n=1 Tax=Vibrio ulleungensis TaxID=2807619 RepID=A0ABS2HP40_9VIBR|nr:YciI family protein [Vibrio ulleungensis]MBM7038481.1 hypothetical protein [Vibrio ulleungensis]
MVAWNQYKLEAQERGALALEVYVVHSTPAAEMEVIKQNLPEHLKYQRQLEADGLLMLAGPLSSAEGEEMNGTGFIVYRATSLEHATQLAQDDPMHQSNARSFAVKRWLINEGSFNLSVKLAAQSVGF